MKKNIEITVFHKADGILSKRITLTKSGEVNANGRECCMSRGRAHRVKLNGIHSMAELVGNMASEEALALGRLRAGIADEVQITVKDLEDAASPDTIARTKENLVFAPGKPAYMLLDHDRKAMPQAVKDKLKAIRGFWNAITATAPGLADAAHVTRRSTSSGLYHRKTGEPLGGSLNRHVYVAVKDGADIERALKALQDRLWLDGYGYCSVGKVGQLLTRSIIDTSVYDPSRLVFEGAPIVEAPLKQDMSVRRPQAYEGEIIDTLVAIPPLSADEQARVTKLKAAERERLKPEAVKERRKWAKTFAAKHGLSEQEAERIAIQAINHVLEPEFELEFDDPDLGICTVADVLADPKRYINKSLADPLEGLEYGRDKAKVFQQADGRLMINSYAHGGIKYRLAKQGVGLDDFYSYMERASAYFYIPTTAIWPGSRVNARIPPVPLLDANGQPMFDEKNKQKFIPASQWVDQNRPVEQMTWCPGLPMLIVDRLVMEGGWIVRKGVSCFNLYQPPTIKLGDGSDVKPWLKHIRRLYPDDADHIICWLAHRVQHPGEKINHALVLGGPQGIGKDTLLEPVKKAVGNWNFYEISPLHAMGRLQPLP